MFINRENLRNEILYDTEYDNDTVNHFLGVIDSQPSADVVEAVMDKKNDLIKKLDSAELFLRNRADSEPSPLNEFDIEALHDISNLLSKIADKIKSGNIIILPCKIGEKVYQIAECTCEDIDGLYTPCEFYNNSSNALCTLPLGKKCPHQFRIVEIPVLKGNLLFLIDEWGKNVFPTSREAEVAMNRKEAVLVVQKIGTHLNCGHTFFPLVKKENGEK